MKFQEEEDAEQVIVVWDEDGPFGVYRAQGKLSALQVADRYIKRWVKDAEVDPDTRQIIEVQDSLGGLDHWRWECDGIVFTLTRKALR